MVPHITQSTIICSNQIFYLKSDEFLNPFLIPVFYGVVYYHWFTKCCVDVHSTQTDIWCLSETKLWHFTTWWSNVIKWKHFPRYWPFVRWIHQSPANPPRKGQWRGALMLSLICAWINDWVNNREAGDLKRHRAHYDVIVMNDRFPVYGITTNFWSPVKATELWRSIIVHYTYVSEAWFIYVKMIFSMHLLEWNVHSASSIDTHM